MTPEAASHVAVAELAFAEAKRASRSPSRQDVGLADAVSEPEAAALLADSERFITAVRAELERPPTRFPA